MKNAKNGRCSCQGVQFKIDLDQLKGIVNCHCNSCRSMNGSAFSTYAAVSETGFAWEDGEDLLQSYALSEKAKKYFCSRCGTPIYNANPKYPGIKIVYLGTVPDLVQMTPNANLFCESKLEWVDHLPAIQSFLKAKGGRLTHAHRRKPLHLSSDGY